MKNRVIFSFLLLFSLRLFAGDGTAAAAESPNGPAKKNGTRAFLELGGFMAVSTVNYWIKYTKFIEDWQFRLNWQDQKKRLFTAAGWRLDSNAFKSNWTHALSGAVYYSMARSNRLSWLESSLFNGSLALVPVRQNAGVTKQNAPQTNPPRDSPPLPACRVPRTGGWRREQSPALFRNAADRRPAG